MKGMFLMTASISLFAVLLSASSFAVEVSALPQSEFADTEVSTNFMFAVDGAYSAAPDSGTFRRTYEVRSRHIDPICTFVACSNVELLHNGKLWYNVLQCL